MAIGEAAFMKKLVARFGIYIVTSFIIMAIGILLFLLTPLLLWLFDFDSDIFGLLVFLVGLVMFLAGLGVRAVRGRIKTKR